MQHDTSPDYGLIAEDYKRSRPIYPVELFDEITEMVPVSSRELAWDCATGNGQCAVELSKRFTRVIATDISAEQIEQAEKCDNIIYRVEASEKTSLSPESVNLIIVATAIHWFNLREFYSEAKRVLKEDGIIAIFGYGFPYLLGKKHEKIDGILAPFIPGRARDIAGQYRTMDFPFTELQLNQSYACSSHWSLPALLDFYDKSTVTGKDFFKAKGYYPSQDIEPLLVSEWKGQQLVSFNLTARVGRKRKNTSALSAEPRAINFFEAMKLVMKSSLPFGIGRTLLGAYALASALVLPYISKDAVAAGPYITTINFLTMGICRGTLSSVGVLLGTSNGLALRGQAGYERLGVIIRQGMVMSTLLGALIPLVVMLASGKIVSSIDSRDIASQVHEYFTAFAPSIFPTLYFICDMQLSPAIKENGYLPTVSGLLFSGLSLIGIPFALGSFGDYFKGVKGLGLGVSLSSWIIFIACRIYLGCNEKYKKYGLFSTELGNLRENVIEMLKIGWKMGFQVTTEWGNLFILSLLAPLVSEDASKALQPSLQYLTALNISIGFAQGITPLFSNYFGELKAAMKNNQLAAAEIHKKNINQMSKVVTVSSLLLSTIYILPMALASQELAKPFLHSDASQDILNSAGQLMIINGISIIPDFLRNLNSAVLQSYRDFLYPPIASLFIMSGLGIGVGYAISGQYGIEGIFAARAAAISLTSAIIIYRLAKLSSESYQDTYQRVADVPGQISSYPEEMTSPLLLNEDTGQDQEERQDMQRSCFGRLKLSLFGSPSPAPSIQHSVTARCIIS